MLELSKNILRKVSFDHALFYKELKKALKWINSADELRKLKEWCLAEFGQSHELVLQRVFVNSK
ncbi:MAG: hypothetical protein ACK5B9_03590 [Flavobacteriia bacterium]|jgi:hypothetical protein